MFMVILDVKFDIRLFGNSEKYITLDIQNQLKPKTWKELNLFWL